MAGYSSKHTKLCAPSACLFWCQSYLHNLKKEVSSLVLRLLTRVLERGMCWKASVSDSKKPNRHSEQKHWRLTWPSELPYFWGTKGEEWVKAAQIGVLFLSLGSHPRTVSKVCDRWMHTLPLWMRRQSSAGRSQELLVSYSLRHCLQEATRSLLPTTSA